jgi:hypothetical protein
MILNCYFNWRIGENPNEEKEQILTVTRFLKSTEKHHRKTLTSGLLHGKKKSQ